MKPRASEKSNYSSHESLDKTLSFLCECGLSPVVSVKQWNDIRVDFWPNALLRSAKLQQPEMIYPEGQQVAHPKKQHKKIKQTKRHVGGYVCKV